MVHPQNVLLQNVPLETFHLQNVLLQNVLRLPNILLHNVLFKKRPVYKTALYLMSFLHNVLSQNVLTCKYYKKSFFILKNLFNKIY